MLQNTSFILYAYPSLCGHRRWLSYILFQDKFLCGGIEVIFVQKALDALVGLCTHVFAFLLLLRLFLSLLMVLLVLDKQRSHH